MQQYTYLVIVIASIIIPLGYSFHPKMKYIRWWKSILLAISLTAIPFLIWDIIFTKLGIWGFNASYHLPFKLFSLPLEEWLFFWTIPYASIFTHFSLRYYIPDFKLRKKTTVILSVILLLVSLGLAIGYFDRMYTAINFIAFTFVLAYGLKYNLKELQSFFPSFIVILIPFLLVNGILTGSFGFDTVVWYDNTENLATRVFNIPIEDFAYAFTLLLGSIMIIIKINPIKWDENKN